MKSATVAVLVLWASLAVAMETNVFTITNNSGRVYERVRIVKNVGDGVLYMETNGVSGGKIKFADLPIEVSHGLGYNEVSEQIALDRERFARERTAREQEAQARALAEARRVKAIQQTKMVIKGKIIQKVKEGLLVDSMSEDRSSSSPEFNARFGFTTFRAAWTTNGQVYNGWCLLVGHRMYDRLVDGDVVNLVAFPDGQFDYLSVGGSTKTVRRFQASAGSVREIADAPTLAEIRREGAH